MSSKVRLISNIGRLRKERSLSQRQLAQCSEVSTNTIVSWEKQVPTNFSIAFSLESFFRKDIEELFDSDSLEALKDIGSLRRSRLLGEISQAQLASIIGVSENTISTWETGKHKTMHKLERLCQCLNCNLTDLYRQYFTHVQLDKKSSDKHKGSNMFKKWLKHQD